MGDDVRRVFELAAKRADDVGVGAAVGVQRAVVVVGGADWLQCRGWAQARGAQLDIGERNRALGLGRAEAEVGDDSGCRGAQLAGRGLLVLIAPPPVL